MASSHKSLSPYNSQGRLAFWSKSVSNDYAAQDTLNIDSFLLNKGDKIASAGSCFASNMVPYLENTGFEYVRTEQKNEALIDLDIDNFGYSNFSASYGNIYTPRQFLQLITRATGQFKPIEDSWIVANGIADPFRPGMKYKARTETEFKILQQQHFKKIIEVFENANVFVFTLGLTEAWVSKADGAVFPVCPGTLSGEYDSNKHEFKNFSVTESINDLTAAIHEIRLLNKNMRFILTVSPVPLVATATTNHVLVASTYSKSVLRVTAEDVSKKCDGVMYFPSYEIVTGPQAPENYVENDKRNVSEQCINDVMAAFLAHCETEMEKDPKPASSPIYNSSMLSSSIIDAECEEEALAQYASKYNKK
jgi:GSCFA family